MFGMGIIYAGLAGFGQSGKNRPFWANLNRPVQNLSIVQNCPKKQYQCTIWLNFLLSFIKNNHDIQISHTHIQKCYLSLSRVLSILQLHKGGWYPTLSGYMQAYDYELQARPTGIQKLTLVRSSLDRLSVCSCLRQTYNIKWAQ